jgi:hypothetical protein
MLGLKVERDGSRHRARGDIMRSAKRRKEIVQRHAVGQIHEGQAGAPLVLVGAENVVVSDSYVEQISPGDARRLSDDD